VIVIVGNKMDLLKKEKVSLEKACDFARVLNENLLKIILQG